MPLALLDSALSPVIFLDPDAFLAEVGNDADAERPANTLAYALTSGTVSKEVLIHNAENLHALHLQCCPSYVISSSSIQIRNSKIYDALHRVGLRFVGDSLHDSWRTPHVVGSALDVQIEAWFAMALASQESIPYLILASLTHRELMQEALLNSHTVFCDYQSGFDENKLARARLILSQSPSEQ